MDKAPDYESGDSRFESWQGRTFERHQQVSNMNNLHLLEYQSVRVFGTKSSFKLNLVFSYHGCNF